MIDPFVDPTWLRAHRDEVIVVHVGTTMGGADPTARFREHHISGARHVVLDDSLADQPAPVAGRHPLPTAERFAVEMAAVGVGDDAVVVAYDDGMGAFAARLVWMLRIIGQDAAVLDGGLGWWSGPVESGPLTSVASVDRTVVAWPSAAVADADDVAEHAAAGGVVIDSRSAPRYCGDVEPIDAVAGHVPGAVCLDVADNVDDAGMLRNPLELSERFSDVKDDPSPIVYCGSGVTACHNALAIEATGARRPRMYVGSWSGWSSDTSRPVATATDV